PARCRAVARDADDARRTARSNRRVGSVRAPRFLRSEGPSRNPLEVVADSIPDAARAVVAADSVAGHPHDEGAVAGNPSRALTAVRGVDETHSFFWPTRTGLKQCG